MKYILNILIVTSILSFQACSRKSVDTTTNDTLSHQELEEDEFLDEFEDEMEIEEKTDPLNGFMLSPAFDFLFDKGYMSFTDDKRTILSPFLSNMTYSKLGISDNKIITHLPIDGRMAYLEYHRNEILKK